MDDRHLFSVRVQVCYNLTLRPGELVGGWARGSLSDELCGEGSVGNQVRVFPVIEVRSQFSGGDVFDGGQSKRDERIRS